MKTRVHVVRVLIAAAGAALMALAVFATRLGIDHNMQWGPARRWGLAVGAALAAISCWPELRRLWLSWTTAARRSGLRIKEWAGARLADSTRGAYYLQLLRALAQAARKTAGLTSALLRLPDPSSPSRVRLAAWLTAGVVVATEITYVFIISVGTWTRWPEHTAYFSILSQAFRHGQVHLLVEPDPDLASLEDPYDPAMRSNIPIFPDASYFRGKYYLYWGPAPAVLVAFVEEVSQKAVSDQYLVFASVSLVNVTLAWMLFYLWKGLFPATSPLLLAVMVGGAGLVNPLPFLLGDPAVYAAAIATGQGFLLVGLAMALPEWVEDKASSRRLAAAGLAWALAVGSRATLLPAILAPTAWLAVRCLRSQPIRWKSLGALVFPLALGGFALAWYNWVRFDRILETGFKYVLTLRNVNADTAQVFSLRYIPSNLFNYVLMPMRSLSVFPFVKPQWGILSVPILGFRPDGLYTTEQITGLVQSTPLVWLAVVPWVPMALRSLRLGLRSWPVLLRLSLLLAAVALGGFVPLVPFFWATMRYEVDFVPSLVLLSAVGGWMAVELLRRYPLWHLISIASVGVLCLRTLALGLLLGITSYGGRFENLNPALFDWLTRLFVR